MEWVESASSSEGERVVVVANDFPTPFSLFPPLHIYIYCVVQFSLLIVQQLEEKKKKKKKSFPRVDAALLKKE